MLKEIAEWQAEKEAEEFLGNKAISVMRGISKIAAKQGGENVVQNYRLLGKRAFIALGVTIVALQLISTGVGYVVSRRSEEQRVERIVRRIMEEESQKAQAGNSEQVQAKEGAGA